MTLASVTSVVGEKLAMQWPLVLTTALALMGIWVFQTFFKSDPLSNIPLMGSEIVDEHKRRAAFLQNAKAMYDKGYNTAKKGLGLFRIPSARGKSQVTSDYASPWEWLNIFLQIFSMPSRCRRPQIPARTEKSTRRRSQLRRGN